MAQTMQQIADALGLNRVTVSLVINGHAERRGVAPKTVKRVRDYLRESGYVPSREAVALRTGKRCSLGILHCGKLHSHVTHAFNMLVESRADATGGLEIIVRPREGILDGLREMVARGVERVIWMQAGGAQVVDLMSPDFLAMGRRLKPVVYNYRFDQDPDEVALLENGFSLVGISRPKGYAQLAGFLSQEGHRRVLLPDIARVSELPIMDRCLRATLESAGLETVVPRWRMPHGLDLVRRGMRYGQQIHQLIPGDNFSAVVFRDDEVAAGAMLELRQAGVKIPTELAVVSMDGHPLAGVFRVPLTTFAVPVERMVAKTLEICSEETVDEPPRSHRFAYRLIRRASH